MYYKTCTNNVVLYLQTISAVENDTFFEKRGASISSSLFLDELDFESDPEFSEFVIDES